MNADMPRRRLHVIPTRNKRAAFAATTEILRWIEAEGTGIAEQPTGVPR